ncbi:MAG: lysophospholipid acyltransferase family protein [Phycisphaerae bacterium]|nr:lysophospholipid acyltransferase family protein [Phycisphaerae bacterium]
MAKQLEVLRTLRKTITFGALRVGMEVARKCGSVEILECIRRGALAFGRVAWPLRARLATNLRAAGMDRPGLIDAIGARCVDQLMMLAHVFRTGQFATSGNLERFAFDDSLRILEQAHARGRGVIAIAPHICGYPVFAPVVTPRIPCSIYLRRNKDPRKMRITESVGLAGQGHLVSPSANASKQERLKVALDVLRQGRMLFITPDTPRKPDDGVEVSILGRRVYFPTGVFTMALRTGAPVVPVWWHWDGGVYRVRCGEPIELVRGRGVAEQAEGAMRTWAGQVDAHLHEHPDMWWNWLDKRWTRILRGE